MPWQKRTEMSLRYEFIHACQERAVPMAALCRSFDISRKTGYKWLERFEEYGWPGLEDRRRDRPERHGIYASEVWESIFSCKKANPTYGPRKIVKMLCNQAPCIQWPSVSLVKQRFREHGLSVPRVSRQKIVSERLPLHKINAPNAVWSIDFKGWFLSKDGKRCEPLTLLDGYSRYLLLCELVTSTDHITIRPLLEKAFYEYGKPDAIRSDNGPPFGSSGLRGLSPLSIWLLKLGIWPDKIRPGKPGENGRLERLHRTLKADALYCRYNYIEYPERLRSFIKQYNTVRPHESLGDLPPISVYVRSNREYHPGIIEEYEYPYGYRMHKINRHGYLKLPSERIYLSESLAREYVGVNWQEEEAPVLFLGYPLGTINEHRKRTKSTKRKNKP